MSTRGQTAIGVWQQTNVSSAVGSSREMQRWRRPPESLAKTTLEDFCCLCYQGHPIPKYI